MKKYLLSLVMTLVSLNAFAAREHLKTGFYDQCVRVEKNLAHTLEEETAVRVLKLHVFGNTCEQAAERLYDIETLDLSKRNLSITTSFEGFGNLRFLLIADNPIKEVKLKNLPLLTGLFAGGTGAETLSLENLGSLNEVRFRENNLKTLKIKNANNIQVFDVSKNGLDDVSFVSQLPSLTWLFVHENNLKSLNVKNLSQLEVLHAEHNQLTDLNFMKEMQGLNKLYMNDNIVSDLSPLAKIYRLTGVEFDNNQISDISLLGALLDDRVENFSFANNPIVKDEAHCPVKKVQLQSMIEFCAKLRNL